ncbi:MAG: MarR family EPS-associated transcriptional regulator [Proteobacteria bacterium]|nr:MarR family EPS-associated transcriptional regulator [Pseudomonadota bacterium]
MMVRAQEQRDDIHFRVLRLLQDNPCLTQRELASALGVSLGKTNFCVNALLDKGLLKLQNFKASNNKLAYSYLMTPAGIAEKSALTARFLQRKMVEYERLRSEIESLKSENAAQALNQPSCFNDS